VLVTFGSSRNSEESDWMRVLLYVYTLYVLYSHQTKLPLPLHYLTTLPLRAL
jgi:hypothetical protein